MFFALVLLVLYALIPFVEMIAPYGQARRDSDFLYAPPQGVHLIHEGRFVGPSSTRTARSSTSTRSAGTT